MEPFLNKLAKHLLETHSENFSRLCLVFPSRRAGLFFQQYVSRFLTTPVWLPGIYALEDFVVYKSGLALCDPLDLVARLYKVHKSIEKERAKPFSEFISWGNMLLGDFDEIDQYLADGEKVFRYLDEMKAMKYWNPDGKPLTSFETNYLQFYNSLAPCYKLFRENLLADNVAYFGLAFDKLLNDIDNASFSEWDCIVFAGFNALTAAEERLIKYLIGVGKAEIYWDADNYYLQDSRQEAGRFLRDYLNKKTFGPLNWIGNTLGNEAKSLNVIGVPGNIGQAKLAGELVQDIIRKKGTADGIALVLVDEGMLLPVLNSIPDETGSFNVTMGFPLKQTPVFSLLNMVITMFANARRFSQSYRDSHVGDTPGLRFYHKDIQSFLSHSFIAPVRNGSTDEQNKLLKPAVTLSFYSPDELLALLKNYNLRLAAVFEHSLGKKHIEASDVLQLALKIISFLRDEFSTAENDSEEGRLPDFSIESEYLFHAAQLCSKLETIASDADLKPDLETLQSLVNSLVGGMRLPFYGEPLNGMQVMGMLETRLLDFTDIIMISVNEGLLPRGKHHNTFIPDEVRAQFGMQRYSERTAVFAYHFYRLMQRVENAWLIYNTEGDELGGGEKSRFISQLLYELPAVNPKLTITERTLSVTPASTNSSEISVEKTPEVVARLHQLAERGLSPTALAIFMKCNLQFYFSQVLRISEPDQVSETIDAATLGEIVHDALYKIYHSRRINRITPEIIGDMLSEAGSLVRDAFAAKFRSQELKTGKNLLIVKVAENMVKRFLLAEKKFLEQTGNKIEILFLEEELSSFVEITDPEKGEKYKVKLYGKADRIDRVGGSTRIIDYKTGRVDSNELKLDKMQNLSLKEDSGKLLQVLTYALLFSDMHSEASMELRSGIVSLRKISSYLIRTEIGKSEIIEKEMLGEFRLEITDIIGRIFNTAECFSQTSDLEICKMCSFNTICNRTVN